jgi:hypothetical protein
MSSRLRPFSLSERVSLQDAKNDRIDVEIGNWFIRRDAEEINAFFQFLGPYPGDSHAALRRLMAGNRLRHVEPCHFGWMFNRPSGTDDLRSMELKGAGRGSGVRSGRPLASGTLRIDTINLPNPRFDGETWKRLHFELRLNLTRFIRHQRWPRMLGMPVDEWELPEQNMRTLRTSTAPPAQVAENADGEFALDGRDNVLIGIRSLSMGRRAAWELHLRRYVEGFEGAVNDEFERAFVESTSDFETSARIRKQPGTGQYTLRRVETYFEFMSENPTRQVRLLEPLLFARGLRNTSRSYPHGFAERCIEENSRSLSISVPGGRTLAVYAKTSRRIRFEIIHDLDEDAVSALLHAGNSNRKRTDNLDELVRWLSILAEDAVESLNEILRGLEERAEVIPNAATPYELIGRIFSTVGNALRAEAILALLVENGRLVVSRTEAALLPEIRKLRRRGIFQHMDGVDQVTLHYRNALAVLQRMAGEAAPHQTQPTPRFTARTGTRNNASN